LHLVGLPVCCLTQVLNFAQLAQALVEHETLDMEEVKKVIKGESIRAIEQVITEDISRIMSAPLEPSEGAES
jgi:hypothetical protein